MAIYILNAHDITRGVLAVAYRLDDDNDGLFDEDAAGAADAFHGVTGFDDDGDGSTKAIPLTTTRTDWSTKTRRWNRQRWRRHDR